MKIHLLSDIHLESGPYALPDDLECDVIVAAGDIGSGLQGVQWLKTLNKPVIYVLGNHEYWSHKDKPVDMFDLINQVRAESKGTNVHFLENESVVINDVRFMGATLWTDFGKFNPSLITEAQYKMNDYRHMYCPSFYADEHNIMLLYQLADDFTLGSGRKDSHFKDVLTLEFVERGLFHPLVSYLLHKKSIRWIVDECNRMSDGDQLFPGKSVVVTHHHPYYESLRRIGIDKSMLEAGRQFQLSRSDANESLCQVAAYASNVSIHNWQYQTIDPHRARINAWLCGHLHEHLDYMQNGMRVASNARGRYFGPLTQQQAEDFSLFGVTVHPEDVERSQQEFKANPYRGDGRAFDANFIVNLDDQLLPVIRTEIAAVLPKLEMLHDEISEFASHVASQDWAIETAVRESIKVRSDTFEKLATALEQHIAENLGYTFVHAFAGLRITANNLYFPVQYSPSIPGFGSQRKRGRSGKTEEIQALISAQKIVIEKFIALPENLLKKNAVVGHA